MDGRPWAEACGPSHWREASVVGWMDQALAFGDRPVSEQLQAGHDAVGSTAVGEAGHSPRKKAQGGRTAVWRCGSCNSCQEAGEARPRFHGWLGGARWPLQHEWWCNYVDSLRLVATQYPFGHLMTAGNRRTLVARQPREQRISVFWLQLSPSWYWGRQLRLKAWAGRVMLARKRSERAHGASARALNTSHSGHLP